MCSLACSSSRPTLPPTLPPPKPLLASPSDPSSNLLNPDEPIDPTKTKTKTKTNTQPKNEDNPNTAITTTAPPPKLTHHSVDKTFFSDQMQNFPPTYPFPSFLSYPRSLARSLLQKKKLFVNT